MITTGYKRGFLRGLKWDSEDQAISLADVLKSCVRGKVQATDKGLVISSTAGNGRSVSFNTPSGEATPTEIAELAEDLYTRYEEAVAKLDEGSSDEAIFAEMLSCLEAPTELTYDFSLLRS